MDTGGFSCIKGVFRNPIPCKASVGAGSPEGEEAAGTWLSSVAPACGFFSIRAL